MIFIKYNDFIKESITQLRYNIFDWDDNILMMDTKIHASKNINGEWTDILISTKDLVDIKTKYGGNYWDNPEYKMDFNKAFIEFRDYGPRGDNAFLEDVKECLKNKRFGPSWDSFIKTLVNGNLFGIVTTRGHEPQSIRKAVEYIIYNYLNLDEQNDMLNNLIKYHDVFNEDFDYLIDDYLDNCVYIGIMSKYFIELFGYNPSKSADKGKQDAVSYIINKFNKYGERINTPMKIGFSDDDPGYYNAIKKTFIANKELFDKIDFYLFDTSNHELKGGKKEKI